MFQTGSFVLSVKGCDVIRHFRIKTMGDGTFAIGNDLFRSYDDLSTHLKNPQTMNIKGLVKPFQYESQV